MKTMQAGPLVAGYENGFLRRITYGETEVLRMVYFALRDHNWNTLNSHIENEMISINGDDFEIAYECFHLDGGIAVMEWQARIQGNSGGVITFEIRGKALENFRRNRAGFCILHPLNVAGQECTITHPNGTKTTRGFPVEISPENPFKHIRSMRWESAGIPFTLDFDGDVFETEDQRNWGDASFKTFCTPLDIPFPVELRRGDKVYQRVTFGPQGRLQPVALGAPYISVRDTGISGTLPLLGISASTEHHALPAAAISLLRDLKLAHYRIDVHPGRENWVTDFSIAYETGHALALPLEIALHLTEEFKGELEAFVVVCHQNRVRLSKVLLLSSNGLVTGQELIDEVAALKKAFPKVLIGAGTNYNFNEINKNRFDASEADYISFSIDPQEHAFDDLTILENIGALEHLVRSTKAIYGADKPVHISPLTLRKRFNPYATNVDDFKIDELKKADPRQKTKFGAVWTFGAICGLAAGGASAITFYQTVGGQGILSENDETYPLYDTLKSFTPYQGKSIGLPESSNPLAIRGIVLDGKTLALVNLTQEEQTVRWNDQVDIILGPQEMEFHALNRS